MTQMIFNVFIVAWLAVVSIIAWVACLNAQWCKERLRRQAWAGFRHRMRRAETAVEAAVDEQTNS